MKRNNYKQCETCGALAGHPCVDMKTLKAGRHKPWPIKGKHKGRTEYTKEELEEIYKKAVKEDEEHRKQTREALRRIGVWI